jgi:hypothetical protein
VFHPCASVPISKLCLSLLHSLITVAYSRLHECRSTLILPHALVCVRNNPTLVATLRIVWFIKPFTHQTILQWMKPLGCLVDVCSWYPSNIWCRCRDFGVLASCLCSLCETLPFLTSFPNNSGIFSS